MQHFLMKHFHIQNGGQLLGNDPAAASRLPGNGDDGQDSSFYLLLSLHQLPSVHLVFDESLHRSGGCFHNTSFPDSLIGTGDAK
jgi:hypothetical protein